MNTTTTESSVQELPLAFIRQRHLVRAINFSYVDQLVRSIKRVGVKAFPLAVTPDGTLFGGNHRFEAFSRIGVEKCWVHVYQPESIDREAVELNEASEQSLPMNFTDHAEMVWRKVKAGQTQQQVAVELGWTRERVRDYAALQKIASEAWSLIGATFQFVAPSTDEQSAPMFGAAAPFTEGLLRSIIPLTPDQQLELVSELASGKIQKSRFTKLAKDYRARNDASTWVRQQLAGTSMVDRCLAEVAKGIYDAEWQANQGPGQKLKQLVDTIREEWERKNSVTLIHGDFYERVRDVGDDSVDLILTDPPYNVANERVFKFEGRSDISQDFGEWDKFDPEVFIALFDTWAKEFHRILAENGSGYVFTSDRYISHLREALERAGLTFRATLVWHKTNPGTQVVKTNFKSAVEYILFFTKGGTGHTFNWQGENEMHNFIETPICGGSERLVDAKKETLHPTQKPLSVLKHLLEVSSHPGDLCFDGFMGVGSTARAARDMGRKFIGIEQDAAFFEAAQRRMSDV